MLFHECDFALKNLLHRTKQKPLIKSKTHRQTWATYLRRSGCHRAHTGTDHRQNICEHGRRL